MKTKFNISMNLAICYFLLMGISCSPNKIAPVQKDISRSFFRSDWEENYKKYMTSVDDASDTMPGDQGSIKGVIDVRIKKIKNYQLLEQYIYNISRLNSTVIRILTNNIQYDLNIKNSKVSINITNINSRVDLVQNLLDGKVFPDSLPDTADCLWLVKNADNALHLIYHTPIGTIKDEVIHLDTKIGTALQSVQQWNENRQVSIPYEKKYGTILSYWDKGNSYHVFFPWMWNDDDCENGWKCATKDTSVNNLHSAIMKFLCMAKQKGIVESQ